MKWFGHPDRMNSLFLELMIGSVEFVNASNASVANMNQRESATILAGFRFPLHERRILVQRRSVEPTVPVSRNYSPILLNWEVRKQHFRDGVLLRTGETVNEIGNGEGRAIRVMVEHGDLSTRLNRSGKTVQFVVEPLESAAREVVELCTRPGSLVASKIQSWFS